MCSVYRSSRAVVAGWCGKHVRAFGVIASAAMPTFTSLTVASEGAYRIVTLNRPERMNALSRALLHEIGAAFEGLAADTSAHVVILTGAGDKAFCAGADLQERHGMSENEVRALLGLYRRS